MLQTSGRRNGRKYRTSGYNGYNIDCLDNIQGFCGYPSTAKKRCYYQNPVRNSCDHECSNNQKGNWDKNTGQCSVKKALAKICLVSDKQSNTNTFLRKLYGESMGKKASAIDAAPPPDSAGCIWDSSNQKFMPTTYISVPYNSATIDSGKFQVELMSGKDPWYLATLLTKGCNLKASASMCFGESQLNLTIRGFTFLIIGLLIVCCPCITWYCFFRGKNNTFQNQTNYYNSSQQAQSNTMYQPIAQPPRMTQQQGGYVQPSYPVAQQQYMQPHQQQTQPVAVAYAQQY